jgi:HSP20 family protein
MSLMKRSEWPTLGGSLLSNFFDDDRLHNSPWLRGESMPAVNVRENEKNFEVELAAPGFGKKDFKISLDYGVLTISGEKKHETERNEEKYTRREFGYTSFSRSFTMPENVSEDDIQASYEDGVLRLTIAKKQVQPSKPKKAIEIK